MKIILFILIVSWLYNTKLYCTNPAVVLSGSRQTGNIILNSDECQVKDTIRQSINDTTNIRKVPEAIRALLMHYKEENTDNKENILQPHKDFDIDGLVIDETLTRQGHEFYILFYDKWHVPDSLTDYTIVINEKPMPGIGTLIQIRINEEEIFRERISPQPDVIESMVEIAIAQCMDYINTRKENSLEFELEETGTY